MATDYSNSMAKQLLDRLLAGVILIAALPVLGAAALAVRILMGPPVLFSQLRAGRSGSPFRLHKFRTMAEQLDAEGRQSPDGIRLTRLGRFLRNTSIDELPQLWNVLTGEMSVIGPRPLHLRYLPRYDSRQSRRHEVRPGITGLAQVEGRNALDWNRRLELDIRYVDTASFSLDLTILFKTFYCVLLRRGISAQGHATMGEFEGSAGNRSQ
jgi:sugar transferase EpsL